MTQGENLPGESFSLKPQQMGREGPGGQIEWEESWSVWVLSRNVVTLAKASTKC